MMNTKQLTRIFCQIDDFCKQVDEYFYALALPKPGRGKRGPRCCLSDSEIMCILILFQSSGFRNFKIFYQALLPYRWKNAFPKMPSYHRFLEIMPRVLLLLTLFIHSHYGKKKKEFIISIPLHCLCVI